MGEEPEEMERKEVAAQASEEMEAEIGRAHV